MDQFSWWHSVIFPYINFAIFFVVLVYFSRAPLRKLAKQRREDYEALLAKARETQALASQQLAQLNQRWAGLDRELAEIRHRLDEESERESAEIIRKGEELKSYLEGEAERIRTGEVARAQEQLQAQIIEAVKRNISAEVSALWHEAEQQAYIRQQTEDLYQIVI